MSLILVMVAMLPFTIALTVVLITNPQSLWRPVVKSVAGDLCNA